MPKVFVLGQKSPNRAEVQVVGQIDGKITRGSERFKKELIEFHHPDIAFKDEERTGADYMMTPRLAAFLTRLAEAVKKEWNGKVKLRVTEAWDENDEHCGRSSHYEGRAADLTTSDKDGKKLGRLAQLAHDTGIDFSYYENKYHVHVSVKK